MSDDAMQVAPALVVWTCQQNLEGDLLEALSGNDPRWHKPAVCPASPKLLSFGRDRPESEWPKCDTCAMTMVPFRERWTG